MSVVRITWGVLFIGCLTLSGCVNDKPADGFFLPGDLVDIQAQTWPKQSLDKQLLLINFWAEWCAPCREEIPELNHLNERANIQVFGIDFDRLTLEERLTKARLLGIDFPVLTDQSVEKLALKWPHALPVTLVVRNGKLHKSLAGAQTEESLLAAAAWHDERVKQDP